MCGRSARCVFVRSVSTLLLAVVSLPAAAYEAVQVTDGGTVKGKLIYQGEVATKKIIPTKDNEVCGAIREDPLILVGPDKGVQDAIVYLKDVQKGKAPGKPAKPPEINNHNCQFEPHVQAVPVKGMRIEKPIKKPGMMRVECDTHGWMLGWVYAAEHPYYAVTKKDGTFSIPDVPPGSYTLVAWQEYTEDTEVPVTVKAKEATQQTIELKKK
jgi:hypothetical protein